MLFYSPTANAFLPFAFLLIPSQCLSTNPLTMPFYSPSHNIFLRTLCQSLYISSPILFPLFQLFSLNIPVLLLPMPFYTIIFRHLLSAFSFDFPLSVKFWLPSRADLSPKPIQNPSLLPPSPRHCQGCVCWILDPHYDRTCFKAALCGE